MKRHGTADDAKEVPRTSHKAWGSNGVRYDEECEVCRRTVEAVDNDTGVCQSCTSTI